MMLKNVLACVFVLCLPTLVLAQNRTAWDGSESTDFFDNANWDSGAPIAGDGAKLTDSFLGPGNNPIFFHPTLQNGSAEAAWFEVTHGVELTIGTNGVLTITGLSDASSMAQATGSLGTLNLVDNGHLHTQSMYAAWEGNAFINMSGNSNWLADGSNQPFTLGHWDDSPRQGVATMTMSDDTLLTVASGDFRIRGNLPCCPVQSSLTLNDNATVILGGDQSTKIQGYIDDGLLINGEFTFDGTNTIITAIGGIFNPPDEFIWTSNSGDWKTGNNWSPPGPPGDLNHVVSFGDSIGDGSEAVFTNSDVTVNNIAIDNTMGGTYTIGGLGSVNLESGTEPNLPATGISVSAGSHEFTVDVILQSDAVVDVATGATLELANDLVLNGNTLTKMGDGMLIISNTLNTGGGTVIGLAGVISGGGSVGGDVDLTGGTISPGGISGGGGGSEGVPEPSAMVLLALGMLASVCRRSGVVI